MSSFHRLPDAAKYSHDGLRRSFSSEGQKRLSTFSSRRFPSLVLLIACLFFCSFYFSYLDVQGLVKDSFEYRKEKIERFASCINKKARAAIDIKTFLDTEYDSVRRSWNRRVEQYPNALTFPESAEQVSIVIQCARQSSHHVCARNGKHSFEGDSCFHGIVVDVSKLQDFDPSAGKEGSFRMGAGLHLGKVALKLAAFNRVLPAGTCASVGLTGLALVGGLGVVTRHLGLTADYVTAIELVDSKGNIILADSTNKYSDYLWLSRGGGAGVQHFPGIITALYVSDLPQIEVKDSGEPVYTKFRIDFNATVESAVQLLLAWQEFYLDSRNLANPLFDRVAVEPWLMLDPFHNPTLALHGYFYGNHSLHLEFMDQFYSKVENLIPGSISSDIRRLDELTLKRTLSGLQNNDELASGHHGYNLVESKPWQRNRWKGFSAVAYDRLTADAFQTLSETIYESKPLSSRFADLRPLGGAVRKLAPDTTAFGHRQALFVAATSHFYLSDDNETYVQGVLRNGQRRQDAFVERMNGSFGGHYAGYIDHGKSIDEDLRLNFGANAVRVRKVKMARDRDNFFSF